MAQILEFTVEGLAGRVEPVSTVLNSDVNVFFGLNGSGKTTLLKILHSALSTDTEILRDLPFTRASVKVYLNRYRDSFVRTFIQKQQLTSTETGPPGTSAQTRLWGSPEYDPSHGSVSALFGTPRAIGLEEPSWTSNPSEPESGHLTTYGNAFLPISRLYRNVRTPTGAKRLSDQELDNAFAQGLQAQWSEYYADISREITKAQEKGLANILGFFLSGEQAQGDEAEAPNATEAYERISGFLRRQPGFSHLIPKKADFASLYAKRPQLRNVVKQIQRVERDIDEIIVPRERFRTVLESMFTGSKHLKFEPKEIRVELADNQRIGLSLLSSGEKQLLFIALHALIGSNHCLIIDEPELSMHVDWQRKLVSTLRDLNPKLQLIMATHSPEIMADIGDDKIFRI